MTTKETKRRGRPAGHNDEVKRQMQAIIDYVDHYAKTRRIAPTLKEIAENVMGNKSNFGNVALYIDELVEEGFLTRAGWHQGRSIAVSNKARRKKYYSPPEAT